MKKKIASYVLNMFLTTLIMALSFSTGCTSAGDVFTRNLAEIGARQLVVSGVRNEFEGPRGTTVNITPRNTDQQKQITSNNSQRYYEGLVSNGGYYSGRMFNNKAYGYGTITYPDGRKYEGEWNEQPEERRKTIEEAIQGQWVYERPHGIGKMTYPDGTIKEGLLQKGEFLGSIS
jgi:hypothetical protein